MSVEENLVSSTENKSPEMPVSEGTPKNNTTEGTVQEENCAADKTPPHRDMPVKESSKDSNDLAFKASPEDKKPNIPLKSSMEILSELFSTFDAEPPVIVKKEKSEHKKHKKSKKKRKHKKRKRKREDSESDNDVDPSVRVKSEMSSPKRVKVEKEATRVKQEKSEDNKDEEKEKVGDKSEKKSKIVIKDLKFSSIFEATIREIKEKQDKDEQVKAADSEDEQKRRKEKHKKKNRKHHKSEERSTGHRSKDRSRSRSRNRRKIDEDCIRKYHSKEKDYYRSSSDKSKERQRDTDRHRGDTFYKEKVEREQSRERHRSRDKERNKYRRDRSGSRDSTSHIDKKKLLEIARRNAIQMMKSGSLPGALTLGPQAQEKVIAAIKAGGKTIEELTEFCKTLSRKEELGELSSISDDNSSDSDNDKAFHHPFQIKDRPTSITMNIKNAIPLPTKTTQERTAELRMQFPVSSGQQHRKTETEWVPVPQKKSEAKQTPAITPKVAAVEQRPTQQVVAAPAKALPGPQVFPKPSVEANIDIGSIVSQRLLAIRKLQENPNDSQAISEMYRAQKEMQSWAESKQQPGQFTGSTGAQIMSPAELSSGFQAWARKAGRNQWHGFCPSPVLPPPTNFQVRTCTKRPGRCFCTSCSHKPLEGPLGICILKGFERRGGWSKRAEADCRSDQLQTAAPVSGGMGMHLLQKMGWKPGEGLGKEKRGALEPLLLEVKLDKKGLVANEEQKRKQGKQKQKAAVSMQGKHPVSLLGEYASKHKIGAPQYDLCFECGPDHKKNFLFKVILNGVEYQPSVASPNKKEAKANAAAVCLQQLGLLPLAEPI